MRVENKEEGKDREIQRNWYTHLFSCFLNAINHFPSGTPLWKSWVYMEKVMKVVQTANWQIVEL